METCGIYYLYCFDFICQTMNCMHTKYETSKVCLFVFFYYRNTDNHKLWKFDMKFILLKRMDERNRYMNLNTIFSSSSKI
jgi:hypothetical protein